MNINEILAKDSYKPVKNTLLETSVSNSGAFAQALNDAKLVSSDDENQPFFMNVLSQTIGSTEVIKTERQSQPVRDINRDNTSNERANSKKNDVKNSHNDRETSEVRTENNNPERKKVANDRSDKDNHEKSNSKADDNQEQKAVKDDSNNKKASNDDKTSQKQNNVDDKSSSGKVVADKSDETNLNIDDKIAQIATNIADKTNSENALANDKKGFGEEIVAKGEKANISKDTGNQNLANDNSGEKSDKFANILDKGAKNASATQEAGNLVKDSNKKSNTELNLSNNKGENSTNTTDLSLTEDEQNLVKNFKFSSDKKASHLTQSNNSHNIVSSSEKLKTDEQAQQLSSLLGDSLNTKVKVKTQKEQSNSGFNSLSSLVPDASTIDDESLEKFSEEGFKDFNKDLSKKSLLSKTSQQLGGNKGQAQGTNAQTANGLGLSEQSSLKAQNQNFASVIKAAGHNTASNTTSSMASQNATNIEGIQSVGGTEGSHQLNANTKAKILTPKQPVNETMAKNAIDQIKVNISKGNLEGLDKINIKLRPKELGHVEVKMELSSDGKLTANISASKAETLEMLQKDVKALEKALNDAGLQTDSGSLNFNFRGQEQQPQEEQKNFANSSTPENNLDTSKSNEEELSEAEMMISQSIASSRSGISIRV